jgi:hypothetical protein
MGKATFSGFPTSFVKITAHEEESRLIDQIWQHSAEQHPAKSQIHRTQSCDRTSNSKVCQWKHEAPKLRIVRSLSGVLMTNSDELWRVA